MFVMVFCCDSLNNFPVISLSTISVMTVMYTDLSYSYLVGATSLSDLLSVIHKPHAIVGKRGKLYIQRREGFLQWPICR